MDLWWNSDFSKCEDELLPRFKIDRVIHIYYNSDAFQRIMTVLLALH